MGWSFRGSHRQPWVLTLRAAVSLAALRPATIPALVRGRSSVMFGGVFAPECVVRAVLSCGLWTTAWILVALGQGVGGAARGHLL